MFPAPQDLAASSYFKFTVESTYGGYPSVHKIWFDVEVDENEHAESAATQDLKQEEEGKGAAKKETWLEKIRACPEASFAKDDLQRHGNVIKVSVKKCLRYVLLPTVV